MTDLTLTLTDAEEVAFLISEHGSMTVFALAHLTELDAECRPALAAAILELMPECNALGCRRLLAAYQRLLELS